MKDLVTLHRRKSGGNYACLMGSLWRHKKLESVSDESLGLWTRVLSYVADSGDVVVTKKRMTTLTGGRGKNGPRKIERLVEAGLLDEVDGGYTPHDWHEHNPSTVANLTANLSSTGCEVESNLTAKLSSRTEQNQQLTLSSENDQIGTVVALREEEKKEENTSTSSPRSRVVDPVFAHWVAVMGMDANRVKLNAKRREKLRARRAEGYTDEQLCQAVDGCKRSPFHMGENDRREVYNDLVTILKDGSAVEKHIARLAGPGGVNRAPRSSGNMGGMV